VTLSEAVRGVSLISRGLDWLTVTVPRDAAGSLLRGTDYIDEGKSIDGFASSQERMCPGGTCWRRFDPIGESKKWGRDYESWLFSGATAQGALWGLRWGESRGTRTDTKFDFECTDDLTPDKLDAMTEEWRREHRIGDGIAGENGVNTRYIGSKASDRRLRIYRKDKESKELFYANPTMRIELTLKHEQAAMMWAALLKDEEHGYAIAAKHIQEMTGFILGPMADVPIAEPKPEPDAAQMVFQFIEQNAQTLLLLGEMGIPIEKLARERAALSSRQSDLRARRRALKFHGVDVGQVVQLVRDVWERRLEARDAIA